MPKSRGRKTHARSSSARPAQTVRPVPPVRRTRPVSRWRRRIGWPLCAVGGVLFLLGNIGARTGIVFLPFDPIMCSSSSEEDSSASLVFCGQPESEE